ncbi:hypothetical protein [Diaminobutyricibacter sp. McL0608]
MSDTSNKDPAEFNRGKKADAGGLPDGSSSNESEDTDRDTASGGPAD